ncbi:MAG: hypothetical protein ISQ23_09015 [Alphaproteobacteria bacterium]|nr:hypothetical protein [Alphaproteobacteria bacterium]MBL6777636.1 hypothetical protein [Alphaproteobacteria bacterium]
MTGVKNNNKNADEMATLAGLAAAIEAEFNTHLADNLPPEQNFRKSMMRRALNILRQNLENADSPEDKLAVAMGQSCAELAANLRTGQQIFPDSTMLQSHLLAYVKAKLSITNPKFLAQQEARQK